MIVPHLFDFTEVSGKHERQLQTLFLLYKKMGYKNN